MGLCYCMSSMCVYVKANKYAINFLRGVHTMVRKLHYCTQLLLLLMGFFKRGIIMTRGNEVECIGTRCQIEGIIEVDYVLTHYLQVL